MPASTYDLLKRTLDGDQQSAEALIKILRKIFEHQAGFAVFRSGGTREDVKEMVNEMFADLFDKNAAALRKFDPEKGASPESFFRHYARLRWWNYLRKDRQKRREELRDPPGLENLRIDDDAESRFTQHADEEATWKRLREVLDSDDYELFDRRYIKLLSTEQICAEFKLSSAAFYQRFSRMLKKLRQAGLLDEGRK